MNGEKVRTADDVYGIILEMSPGDEVTAKVTRILPTDDPLDYDTEEFEITFKLMEEESFVPADGEDETSDGE